MSATNRAAVTVGVGYETDFSEIPMDEVMQLAAQRCANWNRAVRDRYRFGERDDHVFYTFPCE